MLVNGIIVEAVNILRLEDIWLESLVGNDLDGFRCNGVQNEH